MICQGTWINPDGFDLKPILGTKPTLYHAKLDKHKPLTWRWNDGVSVRPDSFEVTDLGSIPRMFWSMVPRDACPRAWIVHDSGYQKHGLYVSGWENAPFAFTPLERKTVDETMLAGLLAEGMGWFTARAVYLAVRAFGWMAWRDKPTSRLRLKLAPCWTHQRG